MCIVLKNSYCFYQVDARDTLTSIGGAWSEFAKKNDGDALLTHSPLGHSIWDFIEGNTTRYLYRIIMKQVRDTGEPIYFPFRGDSPNFLRHMAMKISLGEAASLWFESSISKEIPKGMTRALYGRPHQPIPLIHMCAWCNLVRVCNQWLSLDAAIWVLGLFDTPKVPPITHGMCPECVKQVNQNIHTKNWTKAQYSQQMNHQTTVAR